MTSSIANRITGVALTGGFVLLVSWLIALAGDAEAYRFAYVALTHAAGRAMLGLVVIAFVYHTLAGIRHLLWDMGYFLERRQSRTSAWLIGVATLIVSSFVIYLAFLDTGRSA